MSFRTSLWWPLTLTGAVAFSLGAAQVRPISSINAASPGTNKLDKGGAGSVVTNKPIAGAIASSTNAGPVKTFQWQDVETDEYPKYLDRLRAAGCPEKMVRQIVSNDVNDLFVHKKMNLAIAHDHEWWRFEADPTLT